MRGRVNAINGIFVSCSNELRAFRSGVAARLLGTVPSVLFGASMTLVCISIIYYKTRDLLGVNLMEKQPARQKVKGDVFLLSKRCTDCLIYWIFPHKVFIPKYTRLDFFWKH
ncbi:MAG: hypothetical protein IPP37_07215 [Saprospiraceae bacterium]|nr:hypothetical protein [Saprospiraceae bacterium]